MKVITILALIIAIIALTISYTRSYQVIEIQTKQKQISNDILKLQQEIAKSWRDTKQTEIAKSDWPKYYDATGVLKSVSENQIVVDEDEIPGFMSAMVMSYEVENTTQLEGLKEGDKVKFKIKQEENGSLTVVEIQKKK
jgi:Cu/Ag efflux protein CusF